MGAAMAFGAIFKALMNGFTVRCLMAFLTFRYFTMFIMAEGAVFAGMPGSAGSQCVILLFMTRSTEVLRLLAVEYDIQRLMWVGMTMETIRNGLFLQMPFMTFET